MTLHTYLRINSVLQHVYILYLMTSLCNSCLEESLTSIYAYDSCEPYLFNHAIQLSGWGTEDGVDYWIGRNSWGTYWGMHLWPDVVLYTAMIHSTLST